MQHTKKEKKEYFKSLREKWNTIKQSHTEKDLTDAQAIIASHGLNVSEYSFLFTLIQMRHLKLDGIPYLDCKTYQGWKACGYQVKKGETSKLSGITWIKAGEDKALEGKISDEDTFLFPKEYHLFHRSQVEEV